MPKDRFSDQSEFYATYRPTYPPELFEFVLDGLKQRDVAWDCGTGNGQVARELSRYFKQVNASDISDAQIDKAGEKSNIYYDVCPAEETAYGDNAFDLITVAQAAHWFDTKKFNKELFRVGRPGSRFAMWCYGLPVIDEEIDDVIGKFYHETTGPYWDEERRHIDEAYSSIEFPFDDIREKELTFTTNWPLDHIEGFFKSWSAVQNCIRETGKDPVPELMDVLADLWPEGLSRTVAFPIFAKTGTINK